MRKELKRGEFLGAKDGLPAFEKNGQEMVAFLRQDGFLPVAMLGIRELTAKFEFRFIWADMEPELKRAVLKELNAVTAQLLEELK